MVININNVSSILKNARLEKEIDLTDVSKKIKIPVKYLSALEEGNTKLYPQEPYCSLFVKDYADFLGLNGTEILTLFRRDYYQKRQPQIVTKNRSGITPKFTFALAIFFVILLFSVYLLNEYFKFTRPPKLVVNWPKTTINQDYFDLSGTTDPNATVRINQDLVIVDQDGNFSKKVNLKNSPVKLLIESKSPSGKVTLEEKTITFNQ